MKKLIVMFLFFIPLLGAAQDAPQGDNPFDLEWRKPKEKVDTASSKPSNPWDVVPHSVPTQSGGSDESVSTFDRDTWSLNRFGKEPDSFLFWVVLFNLALLAFVVAVSRDAISKAWNAFFNNNQFVLLFRDWANGQLFLPYLFLYLNFIVNFAFFIYLSLRFVKNKEVGGLALLLLCCLAVGVVFFAKHMILTISGTIYPVKDQAQRYNFLIASSNISTGLFLVPFNLLIAFVPNLEGFLIFWVISLIAIFYLLRAFRSLSFGSKLIVSDKFHFLLYLCAIEVLPILLVFKIVWTRII